MRRPIKPPGGWPWQAPGFKFYTDEMRAWLGGYEPAVANGNDKRSSLDVSIACRKGREASAEAGKGWGKGTIAGIKGSERV